MVRQQVQQPMIPYGRQSIDDHDIEAVVAVLRSDWLTTGPLVSEFERGVASAVGAAHAVAVSNGTAALHATMFALGIGPGDEVVVPAMTFAASANCVVYQGGTPVFVDIDRDTLLVRPDSLQEKITPRTRALMTVDYAGQPCDYDTIHAIARSHDLAVVADACHALGGSYRGRPVGSLADLSVMSFHPVKHITTGEGGMVTTDDPALAERMRLFRNHGITSDHRTREQAGSWFYEMVDLGFNYRLTDIQCALGLSQLSKLAGWIQRRREIARAYDDAFSTMDAIDPLRTLEGSDHAYHLYVVRLRLERLTADRSQIFTALREQGIGVNVHFIPVHLHPYYRKRFGTGPGLCPVAEAAYERILSLPCYPGMTDADVSRVIDSVGSVLSQFRA